MNKIENVYRVVQIKNTSSLILIDKSIVTEKNNKFYAYSLKQNCVRSFSKDWAEDKLKAVNDRLRISDISNRYEKWKKTENGKEFFQENQKVRRVLVKFNVNHLYHITSKKNLSTIFKYGLLSHSTVKKNKLTYTDISDHDVNVRRAEKYDPIHRRKLHEYVPLYFNPKNAMLYRRLDIQKTLIILCINSDLLLNNNTIFTDGNAANNPTRFYRYTKDLAKLNWDIIKSSEGWDKFNDGKRIKMAECLVFNRIKVRDIKKVICINKYIYSEIIKEIPERLKINLEINSKFYF